MRLKAHVGIWVFLFLTGAAVRVFPQQYIITDAVGGIFTRDQNLSFSIPGEGWLRLLLDSREIYRGAGPAFPELGVPQGEERGFTLSAEYYSADNVLLESRSWYIYIDKKSPALANLEFRNTGDGLRLISDGLEQNVRIRAWADLEGSLVYFPDLGKGRIPPGDSFSALVWAEDLARNYSEPRYCRFEIPQVKIENPIAGEWLNPQTLIVSGAEGTNVYWTADGTNPLENGGTGRLYRGPVRVDKRGRVTVRIAWRDSAGLLREDSSVYSVAETAGIGANENIAAFRKAEENKLDKPAVFSLPDGWLWSIGGVPRDQGTASVTLRPEPLIKRVVALHLSPGVLAAGSGETGVYRFVYLLDGGGTGPYANTPPLPGLDSVPEEQAIYPGPDQSGASPIRLLTAGRCRLIVWPKLPGTINFSWGSPGSRFHGPWREGDTPLPVPLEGGTLNWFVMNGASGDEQVDGPYSVTLPSLRGEDPPVNRGRIAYRNFDENDTANWSYVSALLDYRAGIIKDRIPEVCDGEDLEWAFISRDGKILEQGRRDRLAPAPPELSGIGEGGWTRGPVQVSISGAEKNSTGFISAEIRYASGPVERIDGTGSLYLASTLGEIAEVTVEACLRDAAGNTGPKTVRHFTLDPYTVYASAAPLVTGVPSSGLPSALSRPGGMDNPFSSLEEAIDYALKQSRGDIRIAGTLELGKPVTVTRKIAIDGLWLREKPRDGANMESGAALVLADGFSWNLAAGAGLTLSGVSVERKGDTPFIQAGENGTVTLAGAELHINGPLLDMGKGSFTARDSSIQIGMSGERQIAAFSVRDSRIEINSSNIQLEGNYGLLFSLQGGSFSSIAGKFKAAGGRTASLFALNGTRANFSASTLEAAAGDYASGVEASGCELIISGGTLIVSARDATALLLDRGNSLVSDAQFRLEGSFSARAVEVQGAFPLVQNSRFASVGTAKRTDVFSGAQAAAPQPRSIRGNVFSGFTNIWGRNWPLEKLAEFNLAYAQEGAPNTASAAPDRPSPSSADLTPVIIP